MEQADSVNRPILPHHSPLYPPPPYDFRSCYQISAYCRGRSEAIRRLLPPELDVVSDVFEVFVRSIRDIDGLEPYSEGGVVLTCRYRDLAGGHMAFEYVDTDDALCAGREIWGYPKKMAAITFEERAGGMHGAVTRRGKAIIDIALAFQDLAVDAPNLFPRLEVKRLPGADGPGTGVEQIVRVDFDPVVRTRKTGRATVKLEPSALDPVAGLGPVEVLGGEYTLSSFTLDYGRVLEGRG